MSILDPACVRRAWLTLGGQSVDLQNETGGWFCTELDLGFPAVRDVVSNRPDQDGVDDRTQFYGARAVSASIYTSVSAGARIDAVASQFGPFMQPAARPVLHVILDRPGAAERTMTVRAAGYSWTVTGNQERDIHLQWVAADPYLYDPVVSTVIAWGGAAGAGRTYNLTFNRVYPAGGGTATVGIIQPHGDLPIQPLLRIYGPVTGPTVTFSIFPSGGGQTWAYVSFVNTFVLGVNQWVDVDTDARTAFRQSDPAQPAFSSLNFASTLWPVLPVAPASTQMSLAGSSMSGVTQVQAMWHDGYLT